jgi:hypothetical protein
MWKDRSLTSHPLRSPIPEEGKFEEVLSLLVLPGLDSVTMKRDLVHQGFSLIRFVNLSLEMKTSEEGALNVKSQGEARLRRESTFFRLQGAITQGQRRENRASVDLFFETGKMPLRWIPFPEEVPVRDGVCEAKLRIESNGHEGEVSGKILVDSAWLSITERRTKDYSIKP